MKKPSIFSPLSGFFLASFFAAALLFQVTAFAATAISVDPNTTEAKISGTVTDTSDPKTREVRYGTDQANLKLKAVPVWQGTDEFSVTVTGLQPNTIYYYKLISFVDFPAKTKFYTIPDTPGSFATLHIDGTGSIDSVTPAEKTASATGQTSGVANTGDVQLVYGTSETSQTNKAALTWNGRNFTAAFSGLEPNTKYFYTLRESLHTGGKAYNVMQKSFFKTLATGAPADNSTETTPGTGVTPSGNGLAIKLTLDNPLGETKTLPAFVLKIIDGAILLLTPIVVIMLLYAGFLFVTAQGNSEKLGDAKNALLYTLIGAAVVLGAKGIAIVIQSAIGCIAGSPNC